MPHLDTRLSMLFSIIPLVIADLIEDESLATDDNECAGNDHWKEKKCPGDRLDDLVSSLRILGDYQGLLTPPHSVVSAANQAAAKAMLFLSGVNVGSAYFECTSVKDLPLNCCT